MRNLEFYFSEKTYRELENMRKNGKNKYFNSAARVLETELTDLQFQNLLFGSLEGASERFDIHFLSKEPKTREFYPSEKANRLFSQTGLSMQHIENEYNQNLARGKVYLGLHSVLSNKEYPEYTLGAYTECYNHILYLMKWKRNATGVCFIDDTNMFRHETRIIDRGNYIITPKHLGLVKALIGDIHDADYTECKEKDFYNSLPDDTFYDNL